MTDSAHAVSTVPSPGNEASVPINDLLAIPEIVNQLPDWVQEPFRRYVHLKQRNWPAKTVKRSTSLLCRHLVPMIQYLNAEGDCQNWTDWSVRLIEAYIDDKLRYGWAASTVNLDLSFFRSFCWFAIDEGYPVPQILTRIKRLDTPVRLPRPLSDEQVECLEACIQEAISQAEREFHRKVAIRDLACFYLMWHCGLRVSEVSGLLVSDVDLSGRKLFIQHSKERKDRMLYISQTTTETLRKHLANRRRPKSPYLFAGRHGPLTARTVRYRLCMYGERCDVPVTPHRLRHTFASQMLSAGMSILSLQRYLGHEDLNTTLIYAEVSDPMLQKDYYRGAATFDPASAELARRVMDLSQRDELRQLIAELKYPELEPRRRKEILEQMESILAESELESDVQEGGS
jgi:site-specific recombinase XerD